MDTLFIAIIVIIVIYFIAKRFTKMEEEKYVQENVEEKKSMDLNNIDHINDVVVTFVYLQKGDQFLMQSKPNVVINDIEKHKMYDNQLILKLNPKFSLYFGVPYMGGDSFKYRGEFNLEPGFHYEITFKPKIFIFQPSKVTVTKIKSLSPVIPQEEKEMFDF